MQILITGGAGYVGSVIVHKLVKQGYNVIVIDNLEQGHLEVLPKNIKFYRADIGDIDSLIHIFVENEITHIIHCAAYTDVGESMKNSIKYFHNNIAKPINLLRVMESFGCKNIIFSSSCAVYGLPKELPLTENNPKQPVNIYGYTKNIFEDLLDVTTHYSGFNCVCLRYFNACGAYIDEENDIIVTEQHNPETHLIPIVIKNIINRDIVKIFGNDYQTFDGTCIRDYIHVEDLADAHILALNKSGKYNLGTGYGYSVKQIINTIEKISGIKANVEICPRREGDAPELYADNTKAINELGWTPKHNLESIISSAYRGYWEGNGSHNKAFNV
jgi:UDP-glucose 4-epimerase